MDDEVSERDIALETFRQTRAVKWLLAVALGMVLLVVAINVVSDYMAEQDRREACAQWEATRAQMDDFEFSSPSLDAQQATLDRRYRSLCG